MSAQAKLIISYRDLKDADFLTKASGMFTCLTGNPNFALPWPDDYPSLADLGEAVEDFEAKIPLAADGDKGAIAAREASRKVLAGIVKEIAAYLELKAKGDVTKLESTGYDLRRPATHTAGPGKLPAPESLKLAHNGEGSIIARAKAVKGAGSYEAWTCIGDPNVEANWSEKANTKGCSRIELDELTAGAKVFVRIRAIGPKGPGEWSNVENIRVL